MSPDTPGINTSSTVAPPASETELLARAQSLAGLTLGQLGNRLNQPLPADMRRAKGWPGQLIEQALGATAASRPEPDFQLLGIELKTLPVNRQGRPRESTYVCTVALDDRDGLHWEDSLVYKKLRRVLWVPLEAEPEIPLAQRRVGAPLLWSPDADDAALLRRDWEELMEMVSLGRLDQISARHGEVLQIRPKAANARALRKTSDEDGAPTLTLPRGFYLRSGFTASLLARHYVLG